MAVGLAIGGAAAGVETKGPDVLFVWRRGTTARMPGRKGGGTSLSSQPCRGSRERASPEWAETPQAARSRGNLCRAIARDPTEGRGTPTPAFRFSCGTQGSRRVRSV